MPFYYKLGDSWVRLHIPQDIRNGNGECLISIYPEDYSDLEQVSVSVPEKSSIIVITERLDRIFPGQTKTVNRDDIFIYELRNGEIIAVIHSESPIES